jgi:hypothetical protein
MSASLQASLAGAADATTACLRSDEMQVVGATDSGL